MAGRSQRHLRQVRGVDSSGDTTGISPADPIVLTVPTIAGTPTNGSTLTRTNGTFRGEGVGAITTQWYRSTGGISIATAIAGAVNATYVLTGTDVGKKIHVRNSITNFAGTTTADSAQTATIT